MSDSFLKPLRKPLRDSAIKSFKKTAKKMSYQNALQQYFDGELDDVGEDLLFGELAHNHDARREFNEHTKLRFAMQQERSEITPPALAAGAIFGTLGYDLPAPVPVLKAPVSGAIAAKGGMFLKLLPYSLTSLFSALVAVALYSGFTENSFKSRQSSIAEKQNSEVVQSAEIQRNLLKTESGTAGNVAENPPENSFKKSVLKRGTEDFINANSLKNQSKTSLPVFKETENPTVENLYKSTIAVIAKDDFKSDFVFKREDEIFKNNVPEKISIEKTEFLKENEESSPHNFSIEMRSISAKSFPDNSVVAQSEVFKNIAVAFLFEIDANHSIGVEIGREQFAQEYGKNINGEMWTIRQNPLYNYSGQIYRYSFSKEEVFGLKITPFGQMLVGGTYIGPLIKSSVGITITPEQRVSFLLAIEGSLLAYQIDGKWNNSKKLGVTYGVNINF